MKYALLAIFVLGSAQAQTVVYDTFNEADQANLFDCCNMLPIVGAHIKRVDKAVVAVPFTPAAFAKITEVDAALSRNDIGARDDLKIEIAGSSMGMPGKVKWQLTRVPPAGGQCCEYVVARPSQAVHAAPGGNYWIVLKAKGDSAGGWNLNSAGLSGPYAVQGEDNVWTMTEGPLPAVRIIAK